MRFERLIVGCGAMLTLSACATTSFAPPAVNTVKAYDVGGSGCSLSASNKDIAQDQAGALVFLDNFLVSYRCAQRELADGRQLFQVPSALALAGGALVAALGANRNVAIATGSGAAILSQGNKYYAPQEKARFVQAAADALLCMRNEMVGVPALKPLSAQTRQMLVKANDGGTPPPSTATFEPQYQYFVMVGTAAMKVESILAQRLSTIGTYSPDAIALEIAALAKKLDDAKGQPGKDKAINQVQAMGVRTDDPEGQTLVSQTVLLGELQPKLELCTMRARS